MTTFHKRFGVRVEVDPVFYAWISLDLDEKRAALPLQTNGVERHFLLQTLVEGLHRQRRKSPELTDELVQIAEMHLRELPHLLAEMQRNEELNRVAWGLPPKRFVHPAVHVFGVLQAIYTERGDMEAVERVDAARTSMGYNPFA